MDAEDEAAKEHLAAREVARGHEAEVKAAQAGRQKLVKVCATLLHCCSIIRVAVADKKVCCGCDDGCAHAEMMRSCSQDQVHLPVNASTSSLSTAVSGTSVISVSSPLTKNNSSPVI